MKKTTLAVVLCLLFTNVAFARSHHNDRHNYTPPPPVVTPTPPPVPVPPPVIPSPTGLVLGAYNATVGTVHVDFYGWLDIAQGRTFTCNAQSQFIYWENQGVSLDSIINGSQDAVIKQFGNALCPNTILSLFHEMNGNWDSWDANVDNNTPLKVIQAYQHIHNIIGTKVKYAWVLNNTSEPSDVYTDFAQYYPGTNDVDIVGVDGFDFGGQSVSQVFPAGLFTQLSKYGKPVWITSAGAVDNQSQFVSGLGKLPVQGIIYFDYQQFQLNASTLILFKNSTS